MANISQKAVLKPGAELRTAIETALLEHGKVKVVGLGIFEVKRIGKRKGRNPKTGEITMMKAYNKIKFRPTASLKESVQ